MFKNKFKMELSEKVVQAGGKKKKHEKVGEAYIPFPTLDEFGIPAKQYVWTTEDAAKDSKVKAGELAFDNGIPMYDDPKMDWLQNAAVKAIMAASRNKFVKGQLKPGLSLAEDFETLTAETQRTGDALVMRREAKASFEAYLQSLSKKAATIQQLGELFFNSSKVLPTAGERYVEALGKYVGEWIERLDETQKTRFTPKIAELQESINAAMKSEDLEDDDL